MTASRRKRPRHQRKGILSRGWGGLPVPRLYVVLQTGCDSRQRAIEFGEEWAGPAQGVARGGPLRRVELGPNLFHVGWLGVWLGCLEVLAGAGDSGVPAHPASDDDVHPAQQGGGEGGAGLTVTEWVGCSGGQVLVAGGHHRISV